MITCGENYSKHVLLSNCGYRRFRKMSFLRRLVVLLHTAVNAKKHEGIRRLQIKRSRGYKRRCKVRLHFTSLRIIPGATMFNCKYDIKLEHYRDLLKTEKSRLNRIVNKERGGQTTTFTSSCTKISRRLRKT